VELNNIRRALFDLEAKHIRIREHYEDELSRLQREGHVRDSRDLPSSSLGAPLRSPRPLVRQTSTTLAPYQPLHEKTLNGHGEFREPLGRNRDEDLARIERDQDRLTDHRDPKRHRRGKDYRGTFSWSLLYLRLKSFSLASPFNTQHRDTAPRAPAIYRAWPILSLSRTEKESQSEGRRSN